jgi:hypothetical protein
MNNLQGKPFDHPIHKGYYIHYPGIVLTTNQSAEIAENGTYIVDNLQIYKNVNIKLLPAMLLSECLGINTKELIEHVKNSNLRCELSFNEDVTESYHSFEVGEYFCKITSPLNWD